MPRPAWASTRQDRKLTTYDVLMGEAKLADAIVPTRIPGLVAGAGHGRSVRRRAGADRHAPAQFHPEGRAGGIFRTRSKSTFPMC